MIIGLSGYARAGKSEAANALRENGWQVRAFADKLREFLYLLNPHVDGDYGTPRRVQDIIDIYGWDGYKETPYNDEIRRLIQTLGTDCGRNMLGNNVWVDVTLRGYNQWDEGTKHWILQDVRFPNEAKAIQRLGGNIIRINKPGVGPVNNHESETALDDWPFDAVIDNDESIEVLHYWIRYHANKFLVNQ